jgi:hypothetical protein
MTAAGGRHVCETLAVGRVAWLDVHRSGRRQLLRTAGRQVELPQLDRIVVMARENDVATVR